MQDPEQGRLVAELTNDIKEMSVEDLWKVHQAVNEIKYVANQQKYRKRGLLLTPPSGQVPLAARVKVQNG